MSKEKGGHLDAYADEPGEANSSTQAEEAEVRFHQNTQAVQRKGQCHHGCCEKHWPALHNFHLIFVVLHSLPSEEEVSA